MISSYDYFRIYCPETNMYYIHMDLEYFDCDNSIETPAYFDKPIVFHMTEEQVIKRCKKLQEITGKFHAYHVDV